MKRLLKTAFIVMMFSVFFVGPASADDKVYTIKFQSFYSPWGQGIAEEFAGIIEKESKGQIKVQMFNVGELASSPDVLKAVKSGVLDLAYGYSFYFTEMPMANIISGLPMSWMTVEEGDAIFFKYGLDKMAKEAYAEQGVTWLGTMWTASYQFLTKTPMKSLADLQKMKVRAIGGSAQVLQKLGVSTVALPSEDLYVALQTGQIDGILWGAPFEYMDGKFYEAAAYLCDTPMFDPSNCDALFNTKTWESLPAELQAAVMKGVEFLTHAYYERGSKDNEKALDTVFKDKHFALPDEDVKELTKAAQVVWDEEAAKSPACAKAVELIRKAVADFGR